MSSIHLRNYGYSCKSNTIARRLSLLKAIKSNNIQIVHDRLTTIINYGNPKDEMIDDLKWIKELISTNKLNERESIELKKIESHKKKTLMYKINKITHNIYFNYIKCFKK